MLRKNLLEIELLEILEALASDFHKLEYVYTLEPRKNTTSIQKTHLKNVTSERVLIVRPAKYSYFYSHIFFTVQYFGALMMSGKATCTDTG